MPVEQAVPASVDLVEPAPRSLLRQHADMAALLLALTVLMGPVVQGGGGRDKNMLLLGLLTLVPAVLLGRVWTLTRGELLLALGPGIGAMIVCFLAPTGWAGAGDVARFFYVGLLWLAVRRIVHTPQRQVLLLVAVSLGGLWQFQQAYLSWWGRGDASHAMSGTFFAPNVFGAYMAGVGLCALVLAAIGTRRLRIAGFVAAPFCLSAVAFSSSRSTIALVVAAAALGLVLLTLRRQWRDAGRFVAVLFASVGLATLLGSSLLMSHPTGALAGAAHKGEAESQDLGSSGGFRLEWWKAAVEIGKEHPVSGAGFGSFGAAESRFQPADVQRSVAAHSAPLQAWAEGGAALGIPVAVALLAMVVGLLRRLRTHSPAALAAVLGGGVMLAHALLDIDAQYPVCLALAVALAAMGVSSERREVRPAGRPWLTAGVVLLAVLIAAAATIRFDAANARYRAGRVAGGAWTGADGPLRDARFDILRLLQGEHDAGLLSRTLKLQPDNVQVAWARATALNAAGQPTAARTLADDTWRARAARQPGQVLSYAGVLSVLGDRTAAASVLVSSFRSATARPTSGDLPLAVLDALAQLGRDDIAKCLVPSLPERLRKGLPAAATTAAPGSCPATLRPFDERVGS